MCYVSSLKIKKAQLETSTAIEIVADLDAREDYEILEQYVEPTVELILVLLFEEEPGNVTFIGSQLRGKMRDDIVTLIRKYANKFAFSADDMPRVDLSIMTHELHIDPRAKVVK